MHAKSITAPRPSRPLLRTLLGVVLSAALALGTAPAAFADESPEAPIAETETPAVGEAAPEPPVSEPAREAQPAPAAQEEPAAEPAFLRQPEPVTAEAGQPAEFSVEFEHAASVRWQESTGTYVEDPNAADAWADLDAEANPSAATERLVLDAVEAAQDGRRYRAAIRAKDGAELASESAALTVTADGGEEEAVIGERGVSEGLDAEALDEASTPAIPFLDAPRFTDGVVSVDFASTRFHGEDLYAGNFRVDWGAVDSSGGQAWVFAYLEGEEAEGVWSRRSSATNGTTFLLRGIGADATEPGTERLIVELAVPADSGATAERAVLHRDEYTLLTEAQGAPYTVTVEDVSAAGGGRVEITGVASGDHPRRPWGMYYQLPGTTKWYGVEENPLDNLNIREGSDRDRVRSLVLEPVTASMSGLRLRTAAIDLYGPNPVDEVDGLIYWFAYEYDGSGAPVGYDEATLTVVDEGGQTLSPPDAGYPVVTTHPQSVVREPGTDGSVCSTFTAYAEGNPYPLLQWQMRAPGEAWVQAAPRVGQLWPNTYGGVCVNNADSGTQVRARFTNEHGTVYSDIATVTIRTALPAGSYWGALDGDPGVTFTVPTAVTVGEATMAVSGTGWKTESGGLGSVVGVRLSDGGEGWLRAAAEVRHPLTGEVEPDPTIWGFARATKFGDFSAELPVPDAWQAGESYRVQFVTGGWIAGDRVRTETTPRVVEVVEPLGEIAPPVLVQGLEDVSFVGTGVGLGGAAPALSVVAESDAPLSYRWYTRTSNGSKWALVSAATGSSYVATVNGRPATTRHVRVVVSNAGGEVSSEATVTRLLSNTYTDRTPVVTWSDPSPVAGSTVTLRGSGFPPNLVSGNNRLLVGMDDTQVLPVGVSAGVRVPTDANGEFEVEIQLPKLTQDDDGDYVPRQAGTERFAVGSTNYASAVYTSITTRAPDAGSGVEAPEITAGLPEAITVPADRILRAAIEVAGDPEDTYVLWTYQAAGDNTVVKTGGYGMLEYSRDLSSFGGTATGHGGVLTVTAVNEAGQSRSYTARTWFDPGDGSPAWPHVTVESTTEAGQTAIAYIQRDVEPGGTARIVGEGWVTAHEEPAGSVIAVKLSYESLYGDVGRYERTGDDVIEHPTAPGDTTIWALIEANPDGSFDTVIDLPASPQLVAGQKLSVLLSTARFVEGDTPRSVASEPLVVGGREWPDENAGGQIQCVPPEEGLSVSVEPNGALGGTLHVVGQGWCHPTDGGSTVAIKLDDGLYSRAADGPDSNATVWAVVEADPLTGNWEIDIDLPDGATSGAHGSVPAFTEGSHWLRFLTGTLKAGDRIRTLGTPSGYDTSFVVGEYAPNGVPDPLEYTEDLQDSVKGGVSVAKTDTAVVATIPGAVEGDWVYLSAYVEDGSPRLPWGGTWFRVGSDGKITASLSGVTLPVGTLKVVAQDGNQGHRGELLGWAWLTVEAPRADSPPATVPDPGTTNRPVVTIVPRTSTPAPTSVPAAPFPTDAGLTPQNTGGLSGVQDGTLVTISLPDSEPGDWVYLYAYSTPIPIGWIQVDEQRQVRVDLNGLPAGRHKVAAIGEDGALVGWVGATIAGPATPAGGGTVVADEADDAPIAAEAPQDVTAAPVPVGGLSATDWWLLAGGAVILAALVLTVVLVRRRGLAAERSAS